MKQKIIKLARFLNRKFPGWFAFFVSFVFFLILIFNFLRHPITGSEPEYRMGALFGVAVVYFADGIDASFDKKSKKNTES